MHELLLLHILSLSLGSPLEAQQAFTGRQVIQPVQEYFNLSESVVEEERGAQILNGFLSYTHIGTDFGFLGPGELFVLRSAGAISCDFPAKGDHWGGVWHSLNGLARENRFLDMRAAYPSLILPQFQPKVVGVQATVIGTGRLKLELKSSFSPVPGVTLESVDWVKKFDISEAPGVHTLSAAVSAEDIPRAKFINWVAEPGSSLNVESIGLKIALPPVDFPTYVFLSSYAKLARCYSESTGMCRDRAHVTQDAFNNVASTGMFALATAAACRAGMVERTRALDVLKQTREAIVSLPKMRGLLPHFVQLQNAKWEPLRGSEYSTVDTALCLFSMRIAAMALGDSETAEIALKLMRAVEFDKLRDVDGYVIHGLRSDGVPLPSVWRDWGGETAIVLMLQRIATGPGVVPKMNEDGRTHRGIGFISEIPSLFMGEFNTDAVTRAGNVNWRQYRKSRLAEQKSYFRTRAPNSLAAKLGLYGLSAGEAGNGREYIVEGVEDDGQYLVFPHYILMSAMMEDDSQKVYNLLATLEKNGWFAPWGLAENIQSDGSRYLPMIGSLNASFEALSAFHLMRHHKGEPNEVYAAASADPVMSDALKAVFR